MTSISSIVTTILVLSCTALDAPSAHAQTDLCASLTKLAEDLNEQSPFQIGDGEQLDRIVVSCDDHLIAIDTHSTAAIPADLNPDRQTTALQHRYCAGAPFALDFSDPIAKGWVVSQTTYDASGETSSASIAECP